MRPVRGPVRQVKLAGQRVELAEIEEALLAASGSAGGDYPLLRVRLRLTVGLDFGWS